MTIINKIGDLYEITVEVMGISSTRTVACDTEEQATEYANMIMLTDLKRNNPKALKDYVTPQELALQEVTVDDNNEETLEITEDGNDIIV